MRTLEVQAYKDANVYVQQLEQELGKGDTDQDPWAWLNSKGESTTVVERQKQQTLNSQTGDAGSEADVLWPADVSVTNQDPCNDYHNQEQHNNQEGVHNDTKRDDQEQHDNQQVIHNHDIETDDQLKETRHQHEEQVSRS